MLEGTALDVVLVRALKRYGALSVLDLYELLDADPHVVTSDPEPIPTGEKGRTRISSRLKAMSKHGLVKVDGGWGLTRKGGALAEKMANPPLPS